MGRSFPRVEFEVAVNLRYRDESWSAASKNVSRSGLCLVLAVAPPMGEIVELTMPIAPGIPPTTLNARIVWSTVVDGAPQLGLQFHAPTDEQINQLISALAALGAQLPSHR